MLHDQWEYHTVAIKLLGPMTTVIDPAEIDQKLNALGRKGWELVGIVPRLAGGTAITALYTFRRQIFAMAHPVD